MIEYKQSQTHSSDTFEENCSSPVQSEGKLSLTKIWQIVIKTKRLPDNFDLNTVFQGVRDRLRDPEREVRQHALRFLTDLIPVTRVSLDDYMRLLLPELLSNLGHTAPALRKGALDTLRTYLRHSMCNDDLLKKILSTTDDPAILTAAPFLISTNNETGVLQSVVDRLWRSISKNQNYQQEISVHALTRIRSILGDERFKQLLGSDRLADFEKLCDIYGLPLKTPFDEDENGEKRLLWNHEEFIEDKVILETEITLKTGPAITMKIHEESRPNSVISGAASSEEDSRQDVGVIRVLAEDSESDFYEEARRTPRKVRFGGESVKMRTPESDSSKEADEKSNKADATIRITVTDAVSIKTRRSLIPVRITSLPPSPKKPLPYNISKRRLHKSTPNLPDRTNSLSRIPLKRTSPPPKCASSEKRDETQQTVTTQNKVETNSEGENATNMKLDTKEAQISTQNSKNTILRPPTSKNKSGNERSNSVSPIPVHNEIQILHNLTRSPERIRSKSITPEVIERTLAETDENKEKPSEDFTENFNGTIQKSTENKLDNSNQKVVLVKQENIVQEPIKSANVKENLNSFVSRPESKQKTTHRRLTSGSKNINTSAATVENLVAPNISNNQSQVLSKPENEEQTMINDNGLYHSFQVCGGESDICEKHQQDSSLQKWNNGNEKESRKMEKVLVTPYNLHESLTISSVNSEEDLWAKSEALDNLIKMLKQPGTCESLEPGPAALLFEALFASQRRDRLHSLTDHAFGILTQGIKNNVLEKCLGRISFGICRMGAPLGLRLALNIVKKLPSRKFLDEILNSCFQHRTREGALQILMAFSRLLPTTDLPVTRMIEFAALALRDRRRRVKQAALEALACFAPLCSNSDVLNVVQNVAEDSADSEQIMQVVRTRLSRRQLPIVDQEGTVRYSTPRDTIESEFLSGHSFQSRSTETFSSPPSSSSGSSGTASVNYWKQNMRHLQDNPPFSVVGHGCPRLSEDDTKLENSQIWAVDSTALTKRAKNIKELKTVANPAVLRPVYLLQPPELAKIGGRGHRKYDRGRSISPPKQLRGQFSEPSTAADGGETTHDIMSGGRELDRVAADADVEHGITEVFDNTSISHNSTSTSIHRRFRYREGFTKSFSSEQLYFKDKPQSQYQSFSLSSRSSSTSTTGSSTKSGIWHRSGIPVPITTETKLKLRTSNSKSTGGSGGPLVARRTPPHANVIQRSPTPPSQDDFSVPTIPLKSYDSESSGYYTPPPAPDQAFVKIDTVESISLHHDEVSNNNNHKDCVDSYINNSSEYMKCPEPEQRSFSVSSSDISDTMGEEILKTPPSRSISTESLHNNNVEVLDSTNLKPSRHSSGSSVKRAIQNMDSTPCVGENKFKSKSVHDLQNFLPEIINKRKNVNSAPPINIDANFNILHSNRSPETTHEVVKSPLPTSPEKILLPESLGSSEDIPSDNSVIIEATDKNKITPVDVPTGSGSKRLVRRFNRSQSIRRSVKETQRVNLSNHIESSLRPFSKPKEALDQTLSQMNSNEWEISIQGLQALSRIASHHPEVIENQIHTVCVNLAKHVKNLRSQVARTACHTATEVFSHCKKGLEMEVEEIIGPLLQRTADTNKFLRADANSTLDVMCEKLPLHRVVTVITTKGCTHQNAVVRATSGRLLADLVKRLGSEKILQLPKDIRDKILLAGTKSLSDGNLETRSYGKEIMGRLIGNAGFSKVLHEAVPQNVLRHTMKALNCLKPIT